MKKILVPTDFSECAHKAEEVAMQLAVKSKAVIYFLHIMPNPNSHFHVPQPEGQLTRNAQKIQAENELKKLVYKAEHMGINAMPVLVFDKGNEKIESYIKPMGIEMVVMGSHGATGFRELVIGSNTAQVVKNSPVPVLVVKQPLNKLSIKNILFASTFETKSEESIDWVIQFARIWNATINILFINFSNEAGIKNMKEGIIQKLMQKHTGVTFTYNSIEANDEEWGIHQFARLADVNVIAITTHDRSGFFRNRTVAEDIVNHEDLPVLVIKD